MNANPVPDDIDCIDLVERVTDFFEGALPAAEAERIAAHLRTCDGCDEYVRQMRATHEATGRVDAGALPAPIRTRLLDAFRAWRNE